MARYNRKRPHPQSSAAILTAAGRDIDTGDPDVSRASRLREIKQAKKIPVTAGRLIAAIQKIVEYNWADEEDDFLDGEHTAPLSHHIFGALLVLDQFLEDSLKWSQRIVYPS